MGPLRVPGLYTGIVAACTTAPRGTAWQLPVLSIVPKLAEIALDPAIPELVRQYLEEARDSLGTPSASVMVAASSVDAMLKEKGFDEDALLVLRQGRCKTSRLRE